MSFGREIGSGVKMDADENSSLQFPKGDFPVHRIQELGLLAVERRQSLGKR